MKISVIYYSMTGSVYRLAEVIAEGAEQAGAEVRLRRVPDLLPLEVIRANDAIQQAVEAQRMFRWQHSTT